MHLCLRTFALFVSACYAVGVSPICFATGWVHGPYTPPWIIAYSDDFGSQWQQSLLARAALNDISCPSQSVCVGALGFGGNLPLMNMVWTADGGQTWQYEIVMSNLTEFASVSCLSPAFCIAVGKDDMGVDEMGGAVATSINGGRTWSAVTEENCGKSNRCALTALQGVACASPSACFAGGGGRTHGTTPGGSQPTAQLSLLVATITDQVIWQQLDSSNVRNSEPRITSVSCANTTCVAVGDNTLVFSTDSGESWTSEPSTCNYTRVACTSQSRCIALVDSNVTIITVANNSIQLETTLDVPGAAWTGISCPSTKQCIITGTGAPMYRSMDGGMMWSPLPQSKYVFTGVSCV